MRPSDRYLAIPLCVIISFGLATVCSAVEFGPATAYPVNVSSSAAVALGDFNGDGKVDMVIPFVNGLNILFGNGNGTFQPAVSIPLTGIFVGSPIAVGDFNADHKLDLVVAAYNGNFGIAVLLGNGDGTFQPPKFLNLSLPGLGQFALVVADFNLDNKADLAVSSLGSNLNQVTSINVLLGNGDGTFQPARLITIPAGTCILGNPAIVEAGDFNNDGKPDLVVNSPCGFAVFLGKGDGTFQPPLVVDLAPFSVTGIQVADLNHDGATDLVVESVYAVVPQTPHGVTSVTQNLSIFLSKGDGTFQAETVVATAGSSFALGLPSFGDSISHAVLGDFNGDGKLDLLYQRTAYTVSSVADEVLLGRENGNFAPSFKITLAVAPIASEDFNEDSLSDLIVFDANQTDVVNVFLNTSPTSGADLAIDEVGGSGQVGLGKSLSYTATVRNFGPNDATGVTFTDTLPNGVNLTSVTTSQGSCQQSGLVITCNMASLTDTFDALVTITVTPTSTGPITNTMSVTAIEPDLHLQNNAAIQNATVVPVFTLTITFAGSASGTVFWNPGGSGCPTACSPTFLSGQVATLDAANSTSSFFAGWSGGCSGTNDQCSVTMNSDQSVTATFNLLPDFTLSPTATNLSVARGGKTTDTLSIAALNGFSGDVALTCSVAGPPPGPSCGISPNSVSPGVSATLMIDASTLSAEMMPRRVEPWGEFLAAALPLGLFACIFAVSSDRTRRRRWGFCLLVMGAASLLAACGTESSMKLPPSPVTYAVTVTATSGSLQHSTTISVTVN